MVVVVVVVVVVVAVLFLFTLHERYHFVPRNSDRKSHSPTQEIKK
jgi:uncharacterized membrane protein